MTFYGQLVIARAMEVKAKAEAAVRAACERSGRLHLLSWYRVASTVQPLRKVQTARMHCVCAACALRVRCVCVVCALRVRCRCADACTVSHCVHACTVHCALCTARRG